MGRIINKLKKVFKSKEPSLKQMVFIKQENTMLYISGQLSNESYTVKEIWMTPRNGGKKFKFKIEKPSNNFSQTIDLAQISFPKLADREKEILYDFHLLVKVPESKLDNLPKEYQKCPDGTLEYLLRLGRFKETSFDGLKPFELDGVPCRVYFTVKGSLSFAFNKNIEPNVKAKVSRMEITGDQFSLEGRLFTKNSLIESLEILVQGRDGDQKTKVPIYFEYLKQETSEKYGLNRYRFKVNIDLSSVFGGQLIEDGVYDLYYSLKLHDQVEHTLVRLGNPGFWIRRKIKSGIVKTETKRIIISPYFTFKKFNLSLQVDSFDPDTYSYLIRAMRWAWLLRLIYRHRDIWIVGEWPYKAQDTGFHFFKYMREKHPEKNVFYVIEEGTLESKNVLPYGNVLYHKSKSHIWHTLMATKVIGSHHADYLFPIRTERFKKAVKATRVFLQHGVMGTKNMVANYGKSAPGFDTDLFLVSSDFEKNMIVQDFGYDPYEVKITGLSRFDSLFANDVEKKSQVLIIPTWRDWIVRDDVFLESEYFHRWRELVSSNVLHKMSEDYGFSIVLCLHPNMRKFTHYFKDLPIKVVSQGEIDVQRLIKESALMITDYSSVAFDFSFLHKPVIYYQFDRRRFIGNRPSHFDLNNDLPGNIAIDGETILKLVSEYAQTHFRMKEEYQRRADILLKYRDRNASERIFTVITEFKPKRKLIKENEFIVHVLNRYRKSRFYYPSMKVFYNIARRVIPVDSKLMLFESGLGKQVSDSPKAIYEEILRRNLDYKKIWVCNDNIRFDDPKTKRIKRLSPQYYYYLARARYWINNQNFPTYIKKREQTTYVQTWHGTPLKKMLFDIEHIQGRKEGYLERVHAATKMWDYLISPSPYATKAFKSAFHYDGNILEVGYPRNDILYHDDQEKMVRKIRNRLDLPEGKKIVLYAPTFRDNQTKKNNKFTFDVNLDFEKMQEALGDEYILLLRMHVVISNKINIPEEFADFVFNVSNYSDIQELLLVTDLLITDYSSVMFDFANTKRPILYYTYDFEQYRDELRGFYMDFEAEAPGPFLRTTEEIIEAIKQIGDVTEKYTERYDNFYNKYCQLEDGKAASRVIDRLSKPR